MPVPAEHILFHHLHDNHYPPIPAKPVPHRHRGHRGL